jgi:hypothetical protein
MNSKEAEASVPNRPAFHAAYFTMSPLINPRAVVGAVTCE